MLINRESNLRESLVRGSRTLGVECQANKKEGYAKETLVSSRVLQC